MDLDTIRRQDGLGVERPGPSTMSRETMASLDERLPSALSTLVAAAKASITDPSARERAILAKLDEALTRTEEGRLRVAMLGQFKRGKSTLLNALLGVPLLPTGITPVTAIPTYVHAANSPLLHIEFEGPRAPLEFARAFGILKYPRPVRRRGRECMQPGAGPQRRNHTRFCNLQRPGRPPRYARRRIDFPSQFPHSGGRPYRLRRRHIRPLPGSSDHRSRTRISRQRAASHSQGVFRPQ